MANGKYNPVFVFICMILMGFVLHDVEATLKTTFIEDLCYNQKTAKIDLRYQPTGILMSLPQTEMEQIFDCEIILSPPRESSVVVSIYSYDVSSNDQLTIEDSDRFKIALTGYGNFKDEKKAIISEGRTIIRYRRNVIETFPQSRQGFQFTFTAVRKPGLCFANEFQCNNRLCIIKEYVCDGHNHCGDGSDQKACVPKDERVSNVNREVNFYRGSNSNVIWISVIGVSGAILFIIVTVFIVVVVRIRKQKASPATNSNSPNGGGNVPLQSVSSTVPQQLPSDTAPSAPPDPEHERFSFYNRVRRSIRGLKNPKLEDASKEIENSEIYQVPSMYPNLDPHEPFSSEAGIVNPDFKNEES